MKKNLSALFFVVLVISFSSFVSSVSAEEKGKWQVDKDSGELFYVSIERDGRDLTEAEELARLNPGTEFPTDLKPVLPERDGFWYYRSVEKYDHMVVSISGKIGPPIEKSGIVVSKTPKFAWWVVFSLVGMAIMVLAGWAFRRKKYGVVAVAAIAAVAVAVTVAVTVTAVTFAFTAAVAVTAATAAAAVAVTAATAAAATVSAEKDAKVFWVFWVMYEIAMVVVIWPW